MRTTITFDPDVEHLLRSAMQASGQSLKATLNEAIRLGLAGTVVTASPQRFTVQPQPMGLRTGIDPARLGELDDAIEADAFLNLSRSLTRAGRER